MVHYVCRERCGSTSPTKGICKTKKCPAFEEPLNACNCKDGEHRIPLTEDSDDEQEESDDSTK